MMPPEIETAAQLEAALSTGSLRGCRIQDLDLTAYVDAVLAVPDVVGLVVLGGRLPAVLDADLRSRGALVFPTDPQCPVNPYRSRLYTAEELYAGLEQGYAATPDARAYAWLQDTTAGHDVLTTLLRAIHDDAVSDALDETLADRPVVGVMGGHALARGSDGYAGAARLGHLLASADLVVATGGGPGAMEAVGLGASSGGGAVLDAALTALGTVPSFVPDVAAWAGRALEVRASLPAPDRVRSVGVPTWFYGHEPPHVFADAIAKYFSNALREDGLLARSTAGVVVLPGAAGTVQEVFQVATRLYYADRGRLPPLVLVDRTHWTRDVPAWAAIEALADGRAMAGAVHLVDSVDEAARIIVRARLGSDG